MPALELSDETYRRVDAFRAVIKSVLDEEVDAEACLGLIFERGLDSMLLDLLGPQDQATLLHSIQHLALREPETVYQSVADMIDAGAKVQQRERHRPRIGFSL